MVFFYFMFCQNIKPKGIQIVKIVTIPYLNNGEI